ncbi:hypothetical protein P280DRAFT_528441 [Massarina eburnea CBS 473.64]|uniref:F-box domain-containing protein n=1 Tax=Massarina eburnea CBS 473.64 TaxID=1395130 RepID=A0A6A6RW43_9PLEO|nr:hypothetical protein P280DRAFT_528441 [Massarina eburnea CBS 473.64]
MATMTQTLSFTPLALDLPSSRMSVDFTNFTLSKPLPPPKNTPLRIRKPEPPLPPHAIPQRRPRPIQSLPEVAEESTVSRSDSTRQPPNKWWPRPSPPRAGYPDIPVTQLLRSNSNTSVESYTSDVSTASTAASSIFSNAQSISTVRTADSLRSSPTSSKTILNPFVDDPATLTSIPQSLLEHIISYALCLPLNVSIGPQNSENRHMQYRYHRAGLDYIDIQLIRKHPIFLVSQHIREVALDVFYEKCDFVIDLQSIYHTRVSSTINDNLKKHQKFWINEQPPKMVRDTLQNICKLHLRLPVASCENSGHRGRAEEDWMDGSDGMGGGGWKIKSLKKEKEDAASIEKCLKTIMSYVQGETESRSRGRSKSLNRANSFRKESIARLRSKSRERAGRGRAQSRPDPSKGKGKRQPLKRMEIVLVKRGPHVMVLPETLGYIKVARSVPVNGFTKYSFELESQKVLWCTKYGKRWRGFEPTGTRLLEDLQGLTITEKPIEPLRTPTSYKFVKTTKNGQLHLVDAGRPKTPIIFERPVTAPDVPPVPLNRSKSTKSSPWGWKKGHKHKDSFGFMVDEGMDEIGSSGTTRGPPTIDELKKIAEDVRNGLY